jgi:hypothetical protein
VEKTVDVTVEMTYELNHDGGGVDKISIIGQLDLSPTDPRNSVTEPLWLKETQCLHLTLEAVTCHSQQARCLLPLSVGPKKRFFNQ